MRTSRWMLVGLLVLAVTAPSWACLAWLEITQINGLSFIGQEVSPSDTLTITGKTDFYLQKIIAWRINDNGLLPALGTATSPYWLTDYFDTNRIIGQGANQNGMLFSPTTQPAFMGVDSGSPYYNGAMFSFDYHVPAVPASTVITISALDGNSPDFSGAYRYDGQIFRAWTPVSFHVIPEPITISLLVIGSLFFRSKQR